MSLSQALSIAMSGLRANQLALSLTSSNVANSDTPGYIRKTVNQVQTSSGSIGAGVSITGVNRELDLYLQQQIRTEQSGASYADLRSSILSSLQSIYGTPGGTGTLETAFNNLVTAVQGLSTSSDSQSARIGVLNAAQSLTQQLNSMSGGIQSLRSQAESGLNSAVNTANTAMQQIVNLNTQLASGDTTDAAAAALKDQRDQYVDQLSQLMDIRVIDNGNNQIQVFTNSGVQLVGAEASTLSFNPQGTVTPNTQWDADPTKSNLGTLTVHFPNGGSLNLIQTNSIRSGTIAGYLELRDKTLVQAQTQLDQFAANMSSLLSDKTTAGTAVSSGASNGFDLDLSGLQNGNIIHLTYTDVGNVQHQLSLVRVDDPSVLPLSNNATTDPNDQVIGIDFSAGMASVTSQLNAALGSAGLQFSNTGSTLRVLDDGVGTATVNAASVTSTASSLLGGSGEVPLFTDGNSLYTGAITAAGQQSVGLAARIRVNSQIVGDPAKLVQYNATTPSGDTKRPDFLYQQLTAGKSLYSPSTGFGTSTLPFQATLSNFSQQIASAQGQAANTAKQIADGQDVVLSTLQQKFNSQSGVNIDDEMAQLLSLQNAYAANARVMSTVKQMFDALLQI
ncbi:flagellar hook-associated protein FlgK [Bradyrhizobium sp. AUGA SZCCT0283]|uniref:flagellar hook-associated protein FlgK n=1 Tax=Bradyrhizobium sp. AUGA SZCCT0283 TaxID=2807671 RepID=UPI001BAD5293|nr:flagellar hook-associated protein FlgK [Bradyrhizobium sp. AUGA SZCCT0283]MBR1278512.1 flagellar hook-associated protein FlgK [Bradyrhizobium sp. AUGA SZCCT0283]